MKPEHFEALSALFDGERVDSSLLAEALRDPDAADLLADFAGLRVLAQQQRSEPSEGFYTRMEAMIGRRRWSDRFVRLVMPAAVAAGLVLASGLTGYALRGLLESPEVVAVAEPAAPRLPPVRAAAVPSLGPNRAFETRLPARPAKGVPPRPDLRLRFLRWQEAAPGLEPHPE